MKRVLVLSAVVLTIGLEVGFAEQAAPSARANDEKQILALEDAIGKAIETGDVALYDKLTASDFQFITGGGAMMSKTDRLALLKKGGAKGFRTSDHRVRFYGDVAVVTGRQGPGEGPIRFTRVLVKNGTTWQAVATQATSIATPKP